MTLHQCTLLFLGQQILAAENLAVAPPTLFIRLIWLLMNLSRFEECNCIYEGVASRMPLNFTKNH